MLGIMLAELAKVDTWLDEYVSEEYKSQPLAQDWARVSKVQEELGEAINELILLTGQNPRKPRNDDAVLLLGELADTALTAILAILHFTKSDARTGEILITRTRRIAQRAMDSKRQPRVTGVHPLCHPATELANRAHDICPECSVRWCESSPACPKYVYDRHPH